MEGRLEALGQCFTFEVLHDQKVRAAVGADVMERADVGMIQARDGFRFALEALAAGRVAGSSADRTLMATVRSRRVSRAR